MHERHPHIHIIKAQEAHTPELPIRVLLSLGPSISTQPWPFRATLIRKQRVFPLSSGATGHFLRPFLSELWELTKFPALFPGGRVDPGAGPSSHCQAL